MSEETKLTEVDKLLNKVKIIYTAVKGADPNAIDLTKVTDEFEKYKYTINGKLSTVETLIADKDKLTSSATDPNNIFQKNKLNMKIDDLFKEIEDILNKINSSIRSQKNKKKGGDISTKEQSKSLIEERFHLLKNKHEGLVVDDKKIVDNKTNLEKLDEILIRNANNVQPDREMNEEEKAAVARYKNEIREQDGQLDVLGGKLKELKVNAKQIGQAIDETGKQIKKTTENAKKTEAKLETTNAKLKDLLNKVRTGDKICVDIILILICLGLIAVLYNVIKSKISSPSTTASTNTSKTFLYI